MFDLLLVFAFAAVSYADEYNKYGMNATAINVIALGCHLIHAFMAASLVKTPPAIKILLIFADMAGIATMVAYYQHLESPTGRMFAFYVAELGILSALLLLSFVRVVYYYMLGDK